MFRSMFAGESVNIYLFAINNKRTIIKQCTRANIIKYVHYKTYILATNWTVLDMFTMPSKNLTVLTFWVSGRDLT